MVNYIPKYERLVVMAERERHDLAVELKRFRCTRLSINGTPGNLGALSEHPDIVDLSLNRCEVHDLAALKGLSGLRKLSVALGPLSNANVHFCANSLEFLSLSRLRRMKDLSSLPLMPKLEHLAINHIHSFVPPDFRLFPNLRHLSIWNTDWNSIGWISYLPDLETLHISQCKIGDDDWRPVLRLERLRHLHGMKNVFRTAACGEFMRLRPDVRVDQGIPADLEKDPELKEFLEELGKGKSKGVGGP